MKKILLIGWFTVAFVQISAAQSILALVDSVKLAPVGSRFEADRQSRAAHI